jgi:large subunit ribosomal protein L6e
MAKSADKLKAARKARRNNLKEENKTLKNSKDWYPVTDTKKRSKRACKVPRLAKLRKGVTPGVVLILLSGRFRGRRVVFLKQLPSGLLLVTGPYQINGVPLKRVNQAYVIPTKTNVSLSKIPQVDKINDQFFNRVKRDESVLIPKDDKEKRERITEERRSAQNAVDTEVSKTIKSVPFLKQYLQNRFSLKNGQQPHLIEY